MYTYHTSIHVHTQGVKKGAFGPEEKIAQNDLI